MRVWCSTPGALPKTVISPESGRMMSRIMRIVVVLPAPLGPRKPRISLGPTSNDRSATTSRRAEAFPDAVDDDGLCRRSLAQPAMSR